MQDGQRLRFAVMRDGTAYEIRPNGNRKVRDKPFARQLFEMAWGEAA